MSSFIETSRVTRTTEPEYDLQPFQYVVKLNQNMKMIEL